MNDSKDHKAAAEPPLDCRVGRIARFFRRIGGWKTYTVRGWYLDANGCAKTYGCDNTESFVCDTTYAPNAPGKPPAANEPNEGENA